jgi:DnaJ-class molecular chaperone
MPQHNPAAVTAQVCPGCDGFPVVAITTGTRHRDGSRVTIRVACPGCKGTGHTTARAAVLARAGR